MIQAGTGSEQNSPIINKEGNPLSCDLKMLDSCNFSAAWKTRFSRVKLNIVSFLFQLTSYTVLMQVSNGILESYIRHCPDPCWPW